MRWSLPLVLVACSSSQRAKPVEPAQPATVANHTPHSCKEAAMGLEGATRSVRSPDNPVAGPLTLKCHEDTWPVAAIDCFATMHEGDLGKCAKLMSEASRGQLFGVLGGFGDGHMSIAVAHARLEQLQVGVQECDAFVTAVASLLSCEQVPLDVRVQLGQETADFWSLPTHRLAAEDVARMSTVCTQSLSSLLQQASNAGCK